MTASGCAETAAGKAPPAFYALAQPSPSGVDPSVAFAIEHAAFFHPECSRSGIIVNRLSDDRRYAELDVCGTPRRYQDIAPVTGVHGSAAPTWIEVTVATAR